MTKRGQGLSLNVIIIAALALIVLVVLAVIFIQKTGEFNIKVSEESKTELLALQASYGQCRPTGVDESQFTLLYSQAETPEAKEEAKAELRNHISECRANGDEQTCEDSGCRWG